MAELRLPIGGKGTWVVLAGLSVVGTVVFAPACSLPCEPGHCVAGQVCGLSGQCEPEFSSGSESPAEEGLRSRPGGWVDASSWGTSAGRLHDEVQIGGQGGQTLYLSFALPEDAETAWLELHLAEDSTYGSTQTLRIADVTAFDEIDTERLPGERFSHIARRSSPADVMRFDVSELVQAARGRLFVAVSASESGESGWWIATPAATPALRPRLLVRIAAPDLVRP